MLSRKRFKKNVRNSKQKWFHDKCRFEYKEQLVGDLLKMIKCQILVHVFVSEMNHIKFVNIQTLKVLHVKKTFFANNYYNLQTRYEIQDEILRSNLTARNQLLIKNKFAYSQLTITLTISCLLLVAISLNCYYYHTKHCLKNKCVLSY